MSKVTVVLDQGASVEVHTEEGSFIISHGKSKLSVRCADETDRDDMGRHKTIYEKRVAETKHYIHQDQAQPLDPRSRTMQTPPQPRAETPNPNMPQGGAVTPPQASPTHRAQ